MGHHPQFFGGAMQSPTTQKTIVSSVLCAFISGGMLMYFAMHMTPGHQQQRFVADALHTDTVHQLDPRGQKADGPVLEDSCGEVEWLIANGGRVLTDGVEAAEMKVNLPNGVSIVRRGLRAKRALPQGEEIVYVPEHLMMTNATARASNNGISWLWDKADVDDVDILTLFVMYEHQNPNSFFKPYLCTLPKVAPQPLFFTAAQTEDFIKAYVRKGDEPALFKMLMNPENVEKAIAEQTADFESRYATLVKIQEEYPKVFPKDRFKREHYFWAYGMLSSRSYAWAVPGVPQGVYSMMPYADLPNRDRSGLFQQLSSVIAFGTHEGKSTTGMSLETSKPVGEGREVFANYGPDCSEHFIMNYGFLPHYCSDELLGLAPNLAS